MDKEERTVPETPEEQPLPQEELREAPPEETPREILPEEAPKEAAEELPGEDHTPEPEGGPSLSKRRRIAVVSYLALLFVVAFVLVAISLASENRKYNDKASSALQKAEVLQQENADLQKETKALTKQVSELQAQLDAVQLQNEYAEAEYAAMDTELKRTQAALNEQTEITAAQQEAADLLFTAVTAWRGSNLQEFRAEMEDLETRKGDLTPAALSVYEFLVGELEALGD